MFMRKDSTQQKQQESIKNQQVIQKLQPFPINISPLTFAVNYGYAIENVWVTILMISFEIQYLTDALIWIIPIILSVLLRPYIIRFLKMRNKGYLGDLQMSFLCLLVGGIGCVVVGWSTLIKKKNYIWRIDQGIIGWTLMDLGFQIAEYFSEQAKQNWKNKIGQKNQQKKTTISYSFIGLAAGYLVSISSTFIPLKHSMKQFYRMCRYSYYSLALLSVFIAIVSLTKLYVNSSNQEHHKKKSQDINYPLSFSMAYYFPGSFQFWDSSFHLKCQLLHHFIYSFINDIVVIYATMWLSESLDLKLKKEGQLYFNGLKLGSIFLFTYTCIHYLPLKLSKSSLNMQLFRFLTILLIIFSVLTFINYTTYYLLTLICLIAFYNQFYHNMIYVSNAKNPTFEECLQFIDRIQKIFILTIMTSFIFFVMKRDDVRDCILWAAGAFVISFVLSFGEYFKKDNRVKAVKVNKIQ